MTIFVAHSLGGLVVEQVRIVQHWFDRKAIINAYNDPDYAALYKI
jgi:hypothetical protein